ncbi:hypothetical protein BU16DRAFT_175098 [Lophium mytilinum]|uniref:Uncharacterized protein n=1 Tax=Lophium mytilinum TaxID=390894 RepID=A0A6A6QAY1_9PEZI|nr:hypothetical protein BU16DRAFT_175098 [Lophium mytilinum]
MTGMFPEKYSTDLEKGPTDLEDLRTERSWLDHGEAILAVLIYIPVLLYDETLRSMRGSERLFLYEALEYSSDNDVDAVFGTNLLILFLHLFPWIFICFLAHIKAYRTICEYVVILPTLWMVLYLSRFVCAGAYGGVDNNSYKEWFLPVSIFCGIGFLVSHMWILLYTFRYKTFNRNEHSEGIGIWFSKVSFNACAPTMTLFGFVLCLGRTPNLIFWLRNFLVLLDVMLFASAIPESSLGTPAYELKETLFEELQESCGMKEKSGKIRLEKYEWE